MTGLLLLVLGGLAAYVWWRLLHGKEQARLAAARSCREFGLQLMDDTVVLDAIEFSESGDRGRYGLKYRFDFVEKGLLRSGGTVLITAGHAPRVIINTPDGRVIMED